MNQCFSFTVKEARAVIMAILITMFLPLVCHAQNLLRLPESIIFDENHNRYLISNYTTGDIVQVDSTGHQSYFVQNANAIQGLEIAGNVVYVGAGHRVRGFNLNSGEMVMDVQVPNVSNLNDVTADTSGNLYASDVFGTKIIKIKISTGTYSVFVDGSGINQPNGIFYDRAYNRILVCSYRSNSPIQAISLADSSVTTIVNTNISYCDGITKDRYGNCYVTSWTTYSIYRFDSLFSGQPQLVYTNSCGPADISYDNTHNVIAIPLQACNSWAAMPVAIGVKKLRETVPGSYLLHQNYPNPFNSATSIRFDLPGKSNVRIIIYDVNGRELTELVSGHLSAGNYEVGWEAGSYPSGVYFCRLEAEAYNSARRMVIVK